MFNKDEMYLFGILVICSLILMPEAFDLHSLDYIDEIISFVTESSSDETAGQQLDQLKIDDEKNYAKIINKYFTKDPHLNVTDEEYEELEGLIGKIDKAWEQFGTKDLTDDEKNELGDLPETLSQLYKIYVGNDDEDNFPTRIANDERPNYCEIKSNEQFRLRKLHQSVILSELRGFILSLKSSEDVEKTTARAILHSEEYILATKNGFKETTDLYRRCDPPEHIRGIVVNDLQTSEGGDNCVSSRGALDSSRLDKCYGFYDRYEEYITICHQKRCNGILFGCIHVGTTYTCELDKKSDRRFQWAQLLDVNNKVYGESTNSCEGRKVVIEEATKRSDYCYTCMCICAEEDGKSIATRTISLIPQFADIQNNMRFLDLSLLDDPIKAPTGNVQYSDPNEALKIRATGFGVDMAQHTIPYIDLQPVALSGLKAPLSGLELIYRRKKGYGGFLGFKIRGYDFVDFFGSEMSQDDLDKYKNDFDEDIVIDIPTKSD